MTLSFLNVFQVLLLGLIQGVTEFLPVSSSGHLALFQHLLGVKPPLVFDVLVHFGTLGALVWFFQKDIKKIVIGVLKEIRKRQIGQQWRLISLLALGSLPAVIAGLFLKNLVERAFADLTLVGIGFLATAFLLFLGRVKVRGDSILSQVVGVGIAQALAVLPGISRSGSTISVGIMLGMKKEEAFRFSFFLGMIAILGAVILQIPQIVDFNANQLMESFLAMGAAFWAGYFSLKLLKSVFLKNQLWYFAFYCLILAGICFLI